jgi:non-heme chloroperoxidase
MPFVPVEPGVRVHVDDTGGVGRPVVFLHGWPLDSRQWEWQIAALQPLGLRCVTVDTRGFGRSDRAWGHYSFDVLADDLRQVLMRLELEDVALVGISLGAGTALRYMARHEGAGVNRVVLCAPPGGWDEELIESLAGMDRLALLRRVVELMFPADGDGYREVAERWFYDMGFAAMPYATSRCLELLRTADHRNDAAAVRAPALVIHGPDDPFLPHDSARALHEALPDARLTTLARGGHGAFFEERDLFNDELVRFVTPATHPACA